MERWGYDETNGVIIGGDHIKGSLHKYDSGEKQGPNFYGDDDKEVTKKASEWFRSNGGHNTYPDGLELRLS